MKEILSYLNLCHGCNKYHIGQNINKCSFCSKNFCHKCVTKLQHIYGYNLNLCCSSCIVFIL